MRRSLHTGEHVGSPLRVLHRCFIFYAVSVILEYNNKQQNFVWVIIVLWQISFEFLISGSKLQDKAGNYVAVDDP